MRVHLCVEQERDYLQAQVEKLEKDNLELKKSVSELSYLLSLQVRCSYTRERPPPYTSADCGYRANLPPGRPSTC
jgi:hypothetical protein